MVCRADKLGPRLAALQEFFENQKNIAAVYLFGSFGTEFAHPFSDIDLAIVFCSPDVTMMDEMKLEADLTRVLNKDEIDVVNLNKAPVSLQYKAVTEGELLHEGSYEAHSDFLEMVYKRYLDYLPDLKAYEREYEKALKEAYLSHG